MPREYRPRGSSITSLEATLLKIRAFEMLLVLFYMEDLKRSVLGTLNLKGNNRHPSGTDSPLRSDCPEKDIKLKEAFRILEAEGILHSSERTELKKLVDYRNNIGHRIHNLTIEIGPYSYLQKLDPVTYEPLSDYDYTAAMRAKDLRQKVVDGMAAKFVTQISLAPLGFDSAESTYLREIKRLKKKATSQVSKVNEEIVQTNRSISAIPKSVLEAANPYHPGNLQVNGRLTRRGTKCIFSLYDAHATPLAAAHLMRISHRSAKYWYLKWSTK